ncbi:hypothetical protein J25TS5_46140 [Paenibacillus faecis]|nr:hypothetical protein J25TS5_46140 [Paenibacillus faecis]
MPKQPIFSQKAAIISANVFPSNFKVEPTLKNSATSSDKNIPQRGNDLRKIHFFLFLYKFQLYIIRAIYVEQT